MSARFPWFYRRELINETETAIRSKNDEDARTRNDLPRLSVRLYLSARRINPLIKQRRIVCGRGNNMININNIAYKPVYTDIFATN